MPISCNTYILLTQYTAVCSIVFNVTRSKAIYYIMHLLDGIGDFIPFLIVINAINGIIEPGQETTVHAARITCQGLNRVIAKSPKLDKPLLNAQKLNTHKHTSSNS